MPSVSIQSLGLSSMSQNVKETYSRFPDLFKVVKEADIYGSRFRVLATDADPSLRYIVAIELMSHRLRHPKHLHLEVVAALGLLRTEQLQAAYDKIEEGKLSALKRERDDAIKQVRVIIKQYGLLKKEVYAD